MCQFWLNENAGTLSSPHFNGMNGVYSHNLNCTWLINVQEGFYINLELNMIWVKSYKNFTMHKSSPDLSCPHAMSVDFRIHAFMYLL